MNQMRKNIISDKDTSLDYLKNKKISIIGYGNQGRAQALNLKDSGLSVSVGLRKNSKSISSVIKDGISVFEIPEAVRWADIICLLIPDTIAPDVYNSQIKPFLEDGKALLFSHGYNIHYKKIIVDNNIDVVMVAPSAGGAIVRKEYKKGYGVPTLLAIKNDYSGSAFDIIKSYSKAIGGTKVCAFVSTFKEETETDIFGEQAILTGGLPYLINSSYNTLIENGYDSTVAWFVCYYEIKTIVDLFHNKGFDEFYSLISDTARYGGISRGKKLIDKNFDLKLSSILEDIKSGKFNKELSKNIDERRSPESFKSLEDKTKEMLELIKNKI
ncbi:MAG: ketol-acid reductoisomerase [Candidatus Marinimicrobia bacterium]|nr:ketol-acid reductoisomerase [Candidatus Neomarinimicrobiota bacterium]|tara:strand:+ start:53296 stop:54276 length:981 start_codon:yes stop_codon:yes gene_type:complete